MNGNLELTSYAGRIVPAMSQANDYFLLFEDPVFDLA